MIFEVPARHTPTEITYASPADPPWIRWLIRSIEHISGQPQLQLMYGELLDAIDRGEGDFFTQALLRLGVPMQVDGELPSVQLQGPLIVVANHPFGVLDGLAICALVRQLRPQFRVLAHALLCREPRLANFLLPIDFADTPLALRANIESKRAALAELARGGTVIVFPAGGVATAPPPLGLGVAVDLPWKTFVAKLAQQSKANIWPLYFHGQNSFLFQWVSQVSLTLRLALLMSELRSKMNQPLRVTSGSLVPFVEIAHIRDRRELTRFLRQRVEALAVRSGPQPH